MRLLQVGENGEFSLTDDLIDTIPPYAILSHTWGEDHEEVNFQDLTRGPRKTKAGYRKLRFCAQQAARDGLQHFWVDTCCIDKSNNTELSEAINSMFRWYSKAAKCYVYLSDVSTNDRDQVNPSLQPCEPAFRNSRWFTRGWTLQELLAPPSVEFFSSKGNRLGDKSSLERQLHEITGIAVQALQGTPLTEFGVDERMSWAKARQTKRHEDKAYSLLGIFNVYMPPIYGEGTENAFHRLQKEIHGDKPLDHLQCAVEARFNSFSNQHKSICLPDTRVDLLRKIYSWADGQDERRLFWLNGLAGTGKSTIARTVARKYFDKTRLGASFFFSRGGGDVSHAGKFVTSIAAQLAHNVPALYRHICDAIMKRSDTASHSLRDQWHHLILRPLLKVDGNKCHSSYVLVVDALDECEDDNNIRAIVQLLAEARLLERVRLRVFLTSRPGIPIRHGFCQIPDEEHEGFVLHSISPSIVDHDISLFLEYNLGLIGQERRLGAGWPGREVVTRLVRNASGLFIWAATACRFISEGRRFAVKRLNTVINSSSSSSAATAPERHLNEIYVTVLRQSIYPDYTDEEREEQYRTLRHILGSIVVLFSPQSARSLSRLLMVAEEDVDQTLEDLHAILDIPEDQGRPLHLHHPSFRDFLLNKDRCGDPNFWVDEKQAHQRLADSCIQLMATSLKQDICGLNSPGALVSSVQRNRVQQHLPPEVQYACLYWIQHFQKSGARLCDNDRVHKFLKEHFLHWLEALSWMQKVSEGIYAITSLESIAVASSCPDLHAFVHDMKRFALYGRPAIDQTPLQVYCSALVFAPVMSVVKKQFTDCMPRWIKRLPKVEKDWNALLQTLGGHSDSVLAVAFSPDGKVLASASGDETVRLWDAGTGAELQTLKGHSRSVTAVAFSPDSKVLATASGDTTVKLWDASTGAELQTLKGHSGWVKAVAFSPNSKVLASVSPDTTVRLWDAGTGAELQTLKGHWYSVNAVAFSPVSKVLASASDDNAVKLWDASTGANMRTLWGDSRSVNAVAFSPDGKVLVSASDDGTVKLWDAGTGAKQQTLNSHSDSVNAVAFSPDSKVLASASGDETVRLWDTGTGAELQTLKGHSNSVTAVAFSPDGKVLATASYDRTVKLWDASIDTELQTLDNNSKSVSVVAFSPNGKVLASVSRNKTVKLWDTSTGTKLQTLDDHTSLVYAVAFSLNSKVLASASYDNTVKLWDTSTGAVLQTLKGYSRSVNIMAFSSNSKVLATTSYDRTVKLWDTGTGAELQTLKGHSSSVTAVALSPNGKVLATASYDRTVKLWDTGTGAELQTLDNNLEAVIVVAFSPDGKVLASVSCDKTVKLWDAGTGVVLQSLQLDAEPRILSFSSDGTFLETDLGTIRTILVSPGEKIFQQSPLRPIFVWEQWLTCGTENMLRLPSDYRPSCAAVYGDAVVLGHASGRLSFFEFAF